MGVFNQLEFVRDKIKHVPGIDDKPSGGVPLFGNLTLYAFKLILKEKEIIFFAMLQWVVIALTYLLWVQMLDWIPEHVWEAAAKEEGGSAADYILLIWSFCCVGLAAYPIGILTGCIGAAHFLNRQEGQSSVAACFALVSPQGWPLWAFHWIDGWYTCRRILARLPSKKRDSRAKRARDEALYYAWKIGVAGVLPSILTGNDLLHSGKNSVIFVRQYFFEITKLRAGYSALCSVIGVAGYIGGLLFLYMVLNAGGGEAPRRVYSVYLWAVIPLMISLAPVMLILRPIYVLALCDLYSDFLEKRGTPVALPPASSRGLNTAVMFGGFAVMIATVYIFRQELGIITALENSYQ